MKREEVRLNFMFIEITNNKRKKKKKDVEMRKLYVV